MIICSETFLAPYFTNMTQRLNLLNRTNYLIMFSGFLVTNGSCFFVLNTCNKTMHICIYNYDITDPLILLLYHTTTEIISTLSSFSRIQIGKQKHVDKSNSQQYEWLKKLQNVLLNFSIGNFSMDYARSCKICNLIIWSGVTRKNICTLSL